MTICLALAGQVQNTWLALRNNRSLVMVLVVVILAVILVSGQFKSVGKMATQYVSGGDLLNKRLGEIVRKLRKASSVRVGFLENATYPDGTSVAQVAAIQDFGAPAAGIPPRPFFRNMVAEKSPEWPAAIEGLVASEDYDSDRILNLIGEGIAGQLRQSIIDFNSVPLSPVTVMLRGMKSNNPNLVVTGATVGEAAARVKAGLTNYGASDKQLVDSGHLLASVDYEVKGTS